MTFAELVYPMAAMFFWTFAVMLRNIQVRLQAINAGELDNAYFEVFRGASPSDVVLKTGNHLKNLAEFPPLFYAACLAAMVAGHADKVFLVALRILHSLVHLTINRIPLRFAFFFASNAVLLAIWVRLVQVVS